KQDASWLPSTRGKAFKMVSQLLYDLPATEKYRILFMERDPDEMLDSQEKMLKRLGRSARPCNEMKKAFTVHLERLHSWLRLQTNMAVLCILYNDLLERPAREADRVCEFLGRTMDIERMTKAVDPTLYRNRKPVAIHGE